MRQFLLLAATLLVGPGLVTAAPLTPVVFNLGWFPSAEFAGVFVALDAGLYRAAGLDVRIAPFSYGLDSTAELTRNPEVCTLGSIEGYILLQKLDRGDALVALSPMLRESPAGAMSLATAEIHSATDFAGQPVGVHAYADELFQWFAHRAGVTDAELQLQRVDDDLAPLLAGEVVAMQGYATEEYVRLQRRVAPQPTRFLSFAAMGFASYSEILYTTRSQLASHSDPIARFVAATRAGWIRAFTDPAAAVAAVAAQIGPTAEPEHIAAALTALRPFVLDANGQAMPAMSVAAWQKLQAASAEMGLIKNQPIPPASWLWTEPGP